MAAPPVPAKIPLALAYLPRFTNKTLPLILAAGSAFLLMTLLIRDVRRSGRRKKHWIPGKYVVLGAFSLQLLGFVMYPVVSISDDRKLDPAFMKELFQKIHDNQVLILGGRVVMCVLMGVMLPEFASSPVQNRLSNMLALLISAAVVSIHIDYEDFIIGSKYLFHAHHNASDWLSLMNTIIVFSIYLFINLLIVAALTSASIRKVVVHRIPVLFSPTHSRNAAGSMVSWAAVEEQVVRSWITARTCQPQYIISRSTLTSSTGFIVTLCVVLYVVESFKNLHVTDPQYRIVIVSQWSIILLGWVIVCWRCITAVFYYPRLMGNEALGLWPFFRLEVLGLWQRVYFGLLELLQEEPHSCFERALNMAGFGLELLQEEPKFRGLKYLLNMFLNVLVYPVAIISIICWLILESVFSNHYVRRLVMRRDNVEISELYNGYGNHYDFQKYSPALVHMPWENKVGLWIANRQSVEMAKAWLEKGESDAQNCKALISLLRNKTSQVLRYTDEKSPFALSSERILEVESGFSIGKGTPKMMAVSLLTVIIELSEFYEFYDGTNTNTVKVTDCINGCYEAWGIMGLVEKNDPENTMVIEEPYRLIHNLKSNRWLGLTLPINNYHADRTIDDAKRALEELEEKGRQKADSTVGYDPSNSKASIAVHYLNKVCQSISNCSVHNMEEMLDVIQSSLADVIRNCLMKVKESITEECKLKAKADMEKEEEKLWNVFYIAGMAKGLTMELNGTLTAAELHSRPLHGRPPLPVDRSQTFP